MRRLFLSLSLLTAALLAGFLACNTNDPEAARPPAKFGLDFSNVVGTQPLQLGTVAYKNASGESFTPTNFNYFVSNIRLIRTDGSAYVVPQDSSYFLIRQTDPATQKITLNNVPEGSYKAVSFVLGVDSLRSTADISKRTGALDPAVDHTGANGMYWSWNSGYIFMKLEGTSPSAPRDATGRGNFRYHIGYFGGRDTKTINNLKTITVSFGADVAQVDPFRQPAVQIQADVLTIFDGTTPISIKAYPEVMISPFSATVAKNYAGMFSYKGLKTAVTD
ncbi:MAG: hypothetical protein H7319_16100 [Spirosoma sp.]|nr:hypothetical protein [Spirosoma sp.]